VNEGEREVRLVVFDLGGVMVRIARSWAEAHETAGLPHHAIVESDEFMEERARLAHDHQVGAIEPQDYFAAVAEVSRGVYAASDIERIVHVWTREEYPGVGEVLDALEAAAVPTAALSNTNPPHWARLSPPDGVSAEYPNVMRIERRYASHLLRLAKPDPAIYEAFEGEAGAAPSGILFFDDTEANVTAARERGWSAEVIDHAGDTAAQMLGWLKRYGVR
jgi:FMN phosphatase YigB (HAD superfamily)